MKDEKEWEVLEQEMNDKLNQMAETYRSAEIPEELRGKVVKAIDRGKQESGQASEQLRADRNQADRNGTDRNRTDRNRTDRNGADRNRTGKNRKGGIYMFRKVLIRTGQTAAAALVVLTVLANSNADIAFAMGKIPVVGAITKVVTFRTYEKQDENYEAKIEVPKVEPESGSSMSQAASEINRSVEDYTNQLIAQFEQDEKDENGQGHRALYTDYKVLTDNDKIFTLRFNIDEIMASSSQSVKIYNVDKKTDKIITLKDLFPAGTDYVKLLSDAAREQMKKNMAEDENKVYFLDDGMGSDFESIKPDQNFYINSAGHLVLVFDETDVAPAYMGVVEIEIPGAVFQYQW